MIKKLNTNVEKGTRVTLNGEKVLKRILNVEPVKRNLSKLYNMLRGEDRDFPMSARISFHVSAINSWLCENNVIRRKKE